MVQILVRASWCEEARCHRIELLRSRQFSWAVKGRCSFYTYSTPITSRSRTTWPQEACLQHAQAFTIWLLFRTHALDWHGPCLTEHSRHMSCFRVFSSHVNPFPTPLGIDNRDLSHHLRTMGCFSNTHIHSLYECSFEHTHSTSITPLSKHI